VYVILPLVGAAGGTFLAIPLQNILGRKNTCLVAYAFCSILGSFLQLFAPNIDALVFRHFWDGDNPLRSIPLNHTYLTTQILSCLNKIDYDPQAFLSL
jgi:hypothetical protein